LKAIIPAAGIGTRLRPHTYTLPKALLYVAGKPIISHILDDVVPLGVSSIVLIVGYKGELIEEYVRRHYPDVDVEFVQQEERRGIGHAIYLTRVKADKGEPLLIILGDTIVKSDLARAVKSPTNVLGVKEVADPRRFGVAELTGEFITRLFEKPEDPPSNLALVGLYYLLDSRPLFEALQREIDEGIMNHGEYQITDALQLMIDDGVRFKPHLIDEWFDCGKPEAMLATNRRLLEDAGAKVPSIEGCVIIPPVSISPDAEISNSIVGPYVSVAEKAVIQDSIVRDSILSEGATVKEAQLESSLVGTRAVVQGGFRRVDIGDSSEIAFK
jgi:glucose-1-phosphate thymidylyltransferase